MQIQINTDHSIEGREALSNHIREVVEHSLTHISDHITRVEIHLTDVNGPTNGPKDLRCAMEARLERHQPLAVTHQAGSLHEAVDGAADKLARTVEHTLGRLRTERADRTDPPPVGPAGTGRP